MASLEPVDVRLWPVFEQEPRAATALPAEGLVLSREALCLTDSRVSRGANAASVVRSGQVSATVRVPAGAIIAPAVLAEVSLASFQTDVSPSTARWKVSPGSIQEPWIAVNGDGFTLALLRAAVWSDASEPMYLFRLPQPAVVAPGTEATFTLPITIALAGASVALSTPLTSAPAAAAVSCEASFDVAPLRRILTNRAAFERAAARPIDDGIRIPGRGEPLGREALAAAISERAPRNRSWFLLPGLRDGGEPLLLLAVRDGAGKWRALDLGLDPAAWTARLGTGSAPLRLPAPEPAQPSPTPLALATPERFGEFVTYDAATAEVVRQLRAAAASPLSVLLLGESGTGKELLAEQLHRESGRTGPFVAVSCAAISENLMESELFGHVDGAYTGARGDRPGAFLAAAGGTLFLDEIGDAPLSVQLGLLRALETRRVKPVGADREVQVDVRFVAATSRDLDELVAAERFRFDLYHRIAQVPVRVPPLRARPADVEWLAEDLLEALARGRRFSEGARAALAAHGWPGNVRELKNTIERAVALSGQSGPLEASELMLSPSRSASTRAPPPRPSRLVFTDAVRALARRAIHQGGMPKSDEHAAKRARAEQRAAFLYLRLEQPLEVWSHALARQFQRLFGPQWASSEGGRGISLLMITLGLNPADPRDRAELAERLEQAGVPG